MKVLFSPTSKKQLKKINIRFQEKILDILEKFEKNEKIDIKKLKGKKDEYRIRVGEYRIILSEMKKNEFLVTKIGVRESIYAVFLV